MKNSMHSVLLVVVFLFATVLSQEEVAPPCNCDEAVAHATEGANNVKAGLESQISDISGQYAEINDKLTQCNSDAASSTDRLLKEQEDLQTKIIHLQTEKSVLQASADKVEGLETNLAEVNQALEQEKTALSSAKATAMKEKKDQEEMLKKATEAAEEAEATLVATKAKLADIQSKTSGYINFAKIKDDITGFFNKLTGKSEEL